MDCHGSQCGFCTPGFVMSLYGLWMASENPTRAEIETALQGNLCRCTGYEPIVKAAEQVAASRPSALFDPIERDRAEVWRNSGPSGHLRKPFRVEKGDKQAIIPAHSMRSHKCLPITRMPPSWRGQPMSDSGSPSR